MPTAADVLAALPLLTWRGLSAPCLLAPFDFSHSQAERRYPYVDGAGHDHTGMDPLKFSARLAFIETVEAGSFTGRWPAWREALFDGSSGDLEHPLLGTIRARVLQGHVDLKAESRAGIFVDVTFSSTLDDPSLPAAITGADFALDTVVAAASSAAAHFGISYPDGEATTTLAGAFKALKGAIFGATLTLNAAIGQVLGNVDTMISAAEALDDPLAWPAVDLLTQLYAGLVDLKQRAERIVARAVGSLVVTGPTTLDAFATAQGNTLSEVMGLNLQALRAPLVTKGTRLYFYTGR